MVEWSMMANGQLVDIHIAAPFLRGCQQAAAKFVGKYVVVDIKNISIDK